MVDETVATSWQAAELEAVVACPSCGGAPGPYRYRSLRDHLEQVPGEWSVRDCPFCGCLMLDPRPTPQSIGRAYASYYTHGSAVSSHYEDNGRSLFWKLANGYLNARYKSKRTPAATAGRWLIPVLFPLRQQLDFFYRQLPPDPGLLLDVGCGNGVFLLRAKAAGWNVVGLEPDPRAAAQVKRSGLDVHQGALNTFNEPGSFDVITSSHVIEHVHDPKVFLEQLFRLLRGGGKLWLATPNVNSMGHRHFGKAWRGLEPPRHLTIFSVAALQSMLALAGFVDIQFHHRGRGASYILRASRELAKRENVDVGMLPIGLVDLLASLDPKAGEELIVTACKPSR